MTSCIFCKIVKGEIPCYKIYEDKDWLAFLDISQIVDGHTLVIPKKHYRWVWELEGIGDLYKVAQKIVKKMQTVSGKEMVVSVTIGNEVAHAHLHLMPDTKGSWDKIWEGWRKAASSRRLSAEEMQEIRKRFAV